jgi:hypothetical protein
MRRRAAFLGTAVAVMSVVLNLAHTASHAGQHVMSLPGWQLVYIAVVIYAAPVVAAVLLWTRHDLGAWRGAFQATAVLLAALQVVGGSVGLWAARGIPRPSIAGPEKRSSGGLAVPDRS